VVTTQTVLDALQRRASTYDKGGEQHYDIISAFIKSVRGAIRMRPSIGSRACSTAARIRSSSRAGSSYSLPRTSV